MKHLLATKTEVVLLKHRVRVLERALGKLIKWQEEHQVQQKARDEYNAEQAYQARYEGV